ncbi:MAG: hypothetical protein ABFS10_07975 [Bacteroidota bacterium]
MKKAVLLFSLSICIMFLYAQNEDAYSPPDKSTNKIYWGIETGIKTFNSQIPDYNFIREEAVYYFGYYDNYSEISLLTYLPFVSLKGEYRTLSDKLWLSAGINYSAMTSLMGKAGYSHDESDYLYLVLSQSENDTYYYRIEEIGENDHYIGIPIDFRYSPFIPRFFRLYFKLGFDLNFKVASKQSIVFYEAAMQEHEEAVLALFDQPNNFYSTGTLGIGFQLGKQNRPNFRIEADFPTFVLTPKAFGLMDHDFGGGGRISFVLPLKNSEK